MLDEADATQPTPAAPDPLGVTDEELDELAILLQEYLSAETFLAKERLVEGNDILLSSTAEAALAGLLVQYNGTPEVMRSLEIHLELLRRARAIGVRQAFVEMRQAMWDVADEQPLPDDEALALVDAIGEFMLADDWAAKRAWLADHPDLLTPAAAAVFESLIRTHGSRNETNIVRQLMVHRDLLRACREVGVEAAFERMENPPDVLDIIADNTIAVLTDHASERKAWQTTVNQSRIRAAETDDQPMLELLRAISRLLGGEDPAAIEVALDGSHLACWQRILAST